MAHLFKVEFIACNVKKLDLINKSLAVIFTDKGIHFFDIRDIAGNALYSVSSAVELVKGEN